MHPKSNTRQCSHNMLAVKFIASKPVLRQTQTYLRTANANKKQRNLFHVEFFRAENNATQVKE